MISAGSTLGILCGASAWPKMDRFDSASAFANTAAEVLGYMAGPTGLGLPPENVLDLFESKTDVITQYRRIREHLMKRCSALGSQHGEGITILFWYVGHGALLGRAGADFCLLVRNTDELLGAESSLRVLALSNVMKGVAQMSSRIFVLDCCHAGEAAHLLQGGLEGVMNAGLSRDMATDRGVALLAATSASAPARLESRETRTLFGKAIMSILTQGSPQHGDALSLRDVGELARLRLADSAEPNPPMPEVHSPSQPSGDLASKPLFPNPAYDEAADTRHIDPGTVDLLSTEHALPINYGAQGRGDDELNRVLLEAPLVEALDAARELAYESSRNITDLVATLPREEWRLRLLRLSLRTGGTEVAPVLINSIIDADAHWFMANNAVHLLSPAQHDQVAHTLAGLIDNSSIEATRVDIEALGRLGAGGYSGAIVRRLTGDKRGGLLLASDDEWNKLGGYVAVALARMVRWCEDAHGPGAEPVRDTSMKTLADFLTDHSDRIGGGAMWDVHREMCSLRAWHADSLIRYFLRSRHERLVGLGADALSHMQLSRGTPAIIRRIDAAALSESTERTLMLALARIGGPSVVEFFLGEGAESWSARAALHRCLDSAPDSQFEALVRQSVDEGPEERWWLYRAIGKRPLPSLIGYLEQGLTSEASNDRGVSALALATALGSDATDRLIIANREAADSIEKNLIAVAILVATRDYKSVEGREESLAQEAWMYEPVLFEDIARAIEGWGGNRGLKLATALRWLTTAP